MGGGLCSTFIMNISGSDEMNTSFSIAMMELYNISVVGLDISGRAPVPEKINVYFPK